MASSQTDVTQADRLADPGLHPEVKAETTHPAAAGFNAEAAQNIETQDQGSQWPQHYRSLGEPRRSEAFDDDQSLEEGREDIGLDELEAAPPDQNPQDDEIYRHRSLEQERRSHETAARQSSRPRSSAERSARLWAQLYLHSYIIFFSILGVLARLGIIALTTYPGAPVTTTVVWANVGGSLVMGFLREDRMLFRRHWHAAHAKAQAARRDNSDDASESSHSKEDKEETKRTYMTSRSKVHGFIGLTVGFCGTFTSFADIIRDAFLAISNDLNTAPFSSQVAASTPQSRPDGYSVLATIGVLWVEVSMSLAALSLGGHLGIATHRWAHVLPNISCEKFLNMAVVPLGVGCWIGSVIMAIWPPVEAWRGQAIFAVAFAPVGALTRLHVSKLLNPKIAAFPLGTFAVNVFGTCVLGMLWDLQHNEVGHSMLACQLLQGVADGFCGGATTVSTWVLELKALRVWHAYVYAVVSLAVSLALMVAIMGSLRWTQGFSEPTCTA